MFTFYLTINGQNGKPVLQVHKYLHKIPPRFLASGDSMSSIVFAFRTGFLTETNVVAEVCNALWKVLAKEYICSM